MIVEKILEVKRSRMKQWPCRSNRASELGHPCLRYLVLNRTRWQEKALPDVELQLVFDLGNVFEQVVLNDLKEAGFTVIEQQRPFEWKEYQITGHIDGKLLIDSQAYPLEIKSMSPYMFDSINTKEDMLNSKFAYMQKYPAQVILYCLMAEKEKGLMLLKNKSTGKLKEVWIDLDYDLGEKLIQKAESINKHVNTGTMPDPIEWDDNICGKCGFLHICGPDRVGKEIEFLEDETLLSELEDYHRLKPMAQEFKQIDEILKKKLDGRKGVIGDFLIDGSYRKRISYDLPAEIKSKYIIESEYWVKKIIRIT